MLRLYDLIPKLKEDPQNFKAHMATGSTDKMTPLRELSRGRFKEWQEYQNNQNFERDYILSLVYQKPGQWLYAGVYRRVDVKKEFDSQKNKNYFHYKTERLPVREELIGRIVVEFKKEFRQSYLLLEKHNEEMLIREILPQPYRAVTFPGYEHALISYEELVELVSEEEPTWKTALENMKGIYLITDSKNGKHYVGSAYGEKALWQRWNEYAKTGHGGGAKLRRTIEESGLEYAKNFQFSILEIRNMTRDDNEIQQREAHWKQVLKSREFGYNDN